ncbi:MAG TPA: hypothetical protein VIK82_06090, partial [Porticoccaceae bacterium]
IYTHGNCSENPDYRHDCHQLNQRKARITDIAPNPHTNLTQSAPLLCARKNHQHDAMLVVLKSN